MGETQKEQKLMVTIDDLVVEFASSMSIGAKAIQAAAETYAMAISRFPQTAETVFAERFPQIRKDTWQLLYDIGRRKLPPQAMMMTHGAVAKLREARLPKQVLERAATAMVRVYDPSTGKYKDVRFTHLTEGQAEIVFNPITHSIRDVKQQMRYVKQSVSEQKKSVSIVPPAYAITDDGIVFRRGGKMTFEEMAEILHNKAMEDNA